MYFKANVIIENTRITKKTAFQVKSEVSLGYLGKLELNSLSNH